MPNGDEEPTRYGYPYGPLGWPPEVGKAPHLGHSKHLCDMAEKGADLETAKNLVKDAEFICRKLEEPQPKKRSFANQSHSRLQASPHTNFTTNSFFRVCLESQKPGEIRG